MDGPGRDWMGWDGPGRDGMGWDGMGRDRMERECKQDSSHVLDDTSGLLRHLRAIADGRTYTECYALFSRQSESHVGMVCPFLKSGLDQDLVL